MWEGATFFFKILNIFHNAKIGRLPLLAITNKYSNITNMPQCKLFLIFIIRKRYREALAASLPASSGNSSYIAAPNGASKKG